MIKKPIDQSFNHLLGLLMINDQEFYHLFDQSFSHLSLSNLVIIPNDQISHLFSHLYLQIIKYY